MTNSKMIVAALAAITMTSICRADTAVVDGIEWAYGVNSYGEAHLQNDAIATSTSGAITIPSSLGGHPVTSIGIGAFRQRTQLTHVTIPEGVTSIGNDAFRGCTGLKSVTIPASVTSIGKRGFYYCASLKDIVFLGNAPSVGSVVLDGVPSECTVTVYEGTAGWDDDGDGKWLGRTLVYRKRPIPQLGDGATAADVAAALSSCADKKLQTCITNVENYTAYRAWAETVKGTNGTAAAGMQTVMESPNSWESFALGSERLLGKPLTDSDLMVKGFVPSSKAGKFDFTVAVEGVDVGSGAPSDAEKVRVMDNLKQVLGLEGATTLTNFSPSNVVLTFDAPEDGMVKFTAGPTDAKAKVFFLKVKVK